MFDQIYVVGACITISLPPEIEHKKSLQYKHWRDFLCAYYTTPRNARGPQRLQLKTENPFLIFDRIYVCVPVSLLPFPKIEHKKSSSADPGEII